ncbi:hypothetical protein ZHAS_00011145 [Anopheles sinensis]|uniref:Uncharacterized protein n=1 Tax=Anopheles sinensis TaxID=74873 RepID=A0A084VZF7_ANOSI|nr:hypothetical protein ZHAS_00011145 [Anopheles sinensis]
MAPEGPISTLPSSSTPEPPAISAGRTGEGSKLASASDRAPKKSVAERCPNIFWLFRQAIIGNRRCVVGLPAAGEGNKELASFCRSNGGNGVLRMNG